MLSRLEPIQIPESNPFEHDTLGRSVLGQSLTTLCRNAPTPYVIGIDGRWGGGKTTFLNMWQLSLKKDGFVVLRFNAWENDVTEDAGVAFMGEIQAAIDAEKMDGSNHPRIASAWKAVKSLAVKILPRVGPAALKIVTHGLIDEATVKNIGSAVSDAASEEAEQVVKEQIEHHAANKKSLLVFREKLSEFASALAASGSGDNQRPLVFLIDELDRCRPTFAIELLERIKHVFSVSGIVFVLAIDRSQLVHSIRAVYGEGFDANDYLRRFIEFSIQLPPHDSKSYLNAIYVRMKFDELLKERRVFNGEVDRAIDILAYLCHAYRFSLRTIEQVMANLFILFAIAPSNRRTMPVELALLVGLAHAKPDLCKAFIAGSIGAKEVQDAMERDSPPNSSNISSTISRVRNRIRALLFCLSKYDSELAADIQATKKIAENTSLPPGEIESAQYLIGCYGELATGGYKELAEFIRLRFQLVQPLT